MTTVEQVIQKLTETIELLKTLKVTSEEKKEEFQLGDLIRYNGTDHDGHVPPKDTVGVINRIKDYGLPIQFKYANNKEYWCEREDCTLLVRTTATTSTISVGDVITYNNEGEEGAPPTGSIGLVENVGKHFLEVKFEDGICTPNPYVCDPGKCKYVMNNK